MIPGSYEAAFEAESCYKWTDSECERLLFTVRAPLLAQQTSATLSCLTLCLGSIEKTRQKTACLESLKNANMEILLYWGIMEEVPSGHECFG